MEHRAEERRFFEYGTLSASPQLNEKRYLTTAYLGTLLLYVQHSTYDTGDNMRVSEQPGELRAT